MIVFYIGTKLLSNQYHSPFIFKWTVTKNCIAFWWLNSKIGLWPWSSNGIGSHFSILLSRNFILNPSKKPWHKTIQVINCTILPLETSMEKKLCILSAYKFSMVNLIHVKGNWPVQGFAWYKMVEIIIAREKFIVYKNVLRNAWAHRTDVYITHMGRVFCLIFVLLHTLIYIQRKHYFAERVCFMCHNLRFLHCILSFIVFIIVIAAAAATATVVIATQRIVTGFYEFCFRKIVFLLPFGCTMSFCFVLFCYICWFAL